MPKVLLGYKRAGLETLTGNSDTNINVESYPEIKENIRIWCFLSIESGFDKTDINTNCLECSELKEVRYHLREWNLQVREMQPKRFIEPLVCTVDGKRVCLTRYLEAVPLPFEQSENLLESACRFVSLLSTYKSYDACQGFGGVWLNNQVKYI